MVSVGAALPEKHRAKQRRRTRARGETLPRKTFARSFQNRTASAFTANYRSRGLHEIDHFVSLANGGAHHPTNIVLACKSCNRKKNRANGPDFIAKLRKAA